MSAAADIADPDEQMLARLAALDLAAAERVHERLMAAEAADEVADLGRTYQRLARSLRQTLALKARLKRERADALKDAPKPRPSGTAIARRVRELRQALHRIVWCEAEHELETFDFLAADLEIEVTNELLKDSFCDEPLDDHVARLALKLNLPPELAETWRDLPDPPCEPEPIDLDFESSG